MAERSAAYAELLTTVESTRNAVVLHNLEGSSLALVAASLWEKLRRPVLILTAGVERAEQLVDDLEFFGVTTALHYPKWEVLPYDAEDLGLEGTSKHLDVFETLGRLKGANVDFAKSPPPVISAPVDAMMQRVLPLDVLESMTVRFAWGERVDIPKLAGQLERAGYERVGVVESRGEFSVRGAIIDIFPPNADDPIRLDLFGDEIESIRRFDPQTQRSLRDEGTGGTVAIPAAALKHHVHDHVRAGRALTTFFDLLPAGTLVLLDAPERYEQVCTYFESAVTRQYQDVLHSKSDLGPPEHLILFAAELEKRLAQYRRIEHSRLDSPAPAGEKTTTIVFPMAPFGSTTEGDGLRGWLSSLRKRQAQDYFVAIVCDNDGQAQRFDEVLRDDEISARLLLTEADWAGFEQRSAIEGYPDILLMVGSMHEGFVLQDARLAIVTDREIFGRFKRRPVYRKIYKGRPIVGSNEIQRNDYIVHVEHGIGRFLGMRQQTVDKKTVDLLELEYAEGNKLLVPVEKIRLVQKYSQGEGEPPALDKLGSGRWTKRRRKSREEIEQMAEALLALHAKREIAQRPPFPADTPRVLEFESAFPYRETPDQLKAIAETKADMQRHRPMDRLVCGDVGYGKTEVAIRAVFKCVQEGRQAAVLVPTTILALQHYQNFKERYADYPVRVELLSRFQKGKEVSATKKAIASGEVHVIVGTHKLLAKDMKFADLGLLVVDEEQRFGVAAKDRLRELRAEVDVLTLTATPIPRTLHMAMAGLRDLSVITTPPPDRHPIKTRIIHWEEEQIAEAILRELNRGGQVFFIHNRIHNIQEIARQLQKIVPHARIGVAHGQLDETELEDHMIRFIKGEYDILVSTTIVESGIDIPNANTIIVNRADAFGLAQLYQLRGRVGREKRRAYAYLIIPEGQKITEDAVRRLAAIEEFTELGAGFNIALRDMEIRGAGNLLGKEQHGIVMEIGFELYCDLLQDAVAKLRGIDTRDLHDVEIKWPISSFIPMPYIPVETQRVNVYKRLAIMHTKEELEDLASELRDRYGPVPEPIEALLEITRARLAATQLDATLIESIPGGARLTLGSPETDAMKAALKPAADATKDSVSGARFEGGRALIVMLKPKEELARLKALRELIERLAPPPAEAPAGPVVSAPSAVLR